MLSNDEIEPVEPVGEATELAAPNYVERNLAAAEAYAAAETHNEVNAHIAFEEILTGQHMQEIIDQRTADANAEYLGQDEEEPLPPPPTPTQLYHDIGVAATQNTPPPPPSAAAAAEDQVIADIAAAQAYTPPAPPPQPQADDLGTSPADEAARMWTLYASNAFFGGGVGGGVALLGRGGAPSEGGSDLEAGTIPDEQVPDVEDVEEIAPISDDAPSGEDSIVTRRFNEHLQRRPQQGS